MCTTLFPFLVHKKVNLLLCETEKVRLICSFSLRRKALILFVCREKFISATSKITLETKIFSPYFVIPHHDQQNIF